MTPLVYRWFGRWFDPCRLIDRLEESGRFEDAWDVAELEQLKHYRKNPRYMWTWEFGENSLRLARLALEASGFEKAWAAAKHSLFLFDWKGVGDGDPLRREAERIIRGAEGNIHPLRLEEMQTEIRKHQEAWDKQKRTDRQLSNEDLHSVLGLIERDFGNPDVHGRWP